MPQDPNINNLHAQEGKINGTDDIKSERTLELVPNITISETGNRKTVSFGAYYARS